MPLAKAMMEAAGNSTQPVYVEDVFQNWLYQGNGTSQTINNGIDLAGKGGIIWMKSRSNAYNNIIIGTGLSSTQGLNTNSTNGAAAIFNNTLNSDGWTINTTQTNLNASGSTYASWTFRKQPKFFDVVTWTGNNANPRTITHNLGSVPGAMFIKATSTTDVWYVYHTSFDGSLRLNTTAAGVGGQPWYRNDFTSTTISVTDTINATGVTYVAYLFAHNAGGFGLTGTDNVISCGGFTTDGSGVATVNLGWEPQWILVRESAVADNWRIFDTMRGWDLQTLDSQLNPNLSDAESGETVGEPTATGFRFQRAANRANIYIAIRRGPMKTPTSGTSVFKPTAYTGNGSTTIINAGFPIDLSMTRIRAAATGQTLVVDRLRGASQRLFTDSTTSESTSSTAVTSLASNTSITFGANGDTNSSGQTYVTWDFQRAPGFFDEVCYTGTGTNLVVNHNLGVTPELIIGKGRSVGGYNWLVYHKDIGSTGGYPNYLKLNDTTGTSSGASTIWGTPTSTTFSYGSNATLNTSGGTYVAYLFASCSGVSKVGSYTGTGSTQQINCGFTAGARFVLIKRTDSTGDWYVWDSARGIVAGNDPYLLLNSTAAEVTTTDYVDTYSAGFEISSTAPAAINASGGTFIYLAIA